MDSRFDIFWWIRKISMFSILFPFIISIVQWKRLAKPLKLLSIYIFATVILEAVQFRLALQQKNNLFAFHLHTVIEVLILGLVLRSYIASSSQKRLIAGAIGVFLIFALINVIAIEKLNEFNGLARTVESAFFITVTASLFHQINRGGASPKLSPEYWLCVGTAFYFAGNIMLFFFSNQLISANTTYFEMAWTIQSVLHLFFNLMLIFVLWIPWRAKEYSLQ